MSVARLSASLDAASPTVSQPCYIPFIQTAIQLVVDSLDIRQLHFWGQVVWGDEGTCTTYDLHKWHT
jgi:hypothetical protein